MGSKRPGHSTRARPAQPALPHPTADPSTIPRGVREAIEHQRLQLTRASTALTCLWIATLYQDWHEVEIDAADVALLTRRVIDEAINALDTVELARAAREPIRRTEPDD